VQLRTHTERAIDELRTATGMRPEEHPPWRIQRTDRFAAVVRQLVKRFGAWIRLLPIAIALLCGAGIFSVQTLQSEQRLAEFGVRRAVGASRAALLGQLVAEAIVTGAAGITAACLLLYATGLFDGPTAHLLGSVALAVAVALPLLIVGILVPGVVALRVTAIASLEGRGP
jgi:putative ABC transport system permease protein